MRKLKTKSSSGYEDKRFAELKKNFTNKNKINFFLSLVFAFIVSIFNIGTAFILQNLTNIAISKSYNDLWKLIKFAIVYFLGFALALYLKGLFLSRFQQKASAQYKRYIFEKCLKKNVSGFHDEVSSIYTSAITNDLNIIEKDYLFGIIEMITQLTLLIFGFVAMVYINWILMLCVLIASVLPIAISLTIGKSLSSMERESSDHVANFIHLMNGLFSGFSVIKNFKAERVINNIFIHKNDEVEAVKYRKRVKSGFVYMLSFICSTISELVVCGIGVYLCIIGKTTLGSVIAFVQLVDFVVQPVQKLGPVLNGIKASQSLILKISQALEKNIERERVLTVNGFNSSIKLKDVSFKYEDNYILNHINLEFDKGKSYAIVGASGSGKSTLLKLLMGHYDNYSGSITIDGNEICNITLDSLYNVVTIIQQNVFIFNESIKTNISMYKHFDNDRLEEAIKKSGLKNLIDSKGVDYHCGENGSNLSGGEKQRLSIARALICHTPILLVDEATSALDTKTSHEIEQEILNINELTRIVITHKLDKSLLKNYDEIIVLKNGEVIERGSYDELINKQDYFYSYVNITCI